MGKLARLAALSSLLLCAAVRAESSWLAGLREGGGGFYLSSPDQTFHLDILGYGQFVGSALSGAYNKNDRPDSPTGFELRRAEFQALATLHHDYEFMIDIGTPQVLIPGAALAFPGNAMPNGVALTQLPLGPGSIGLFEARVTAPIVQDVLQIRAGKFIGPFSRENARSSRNLDTIERSSIINSMLTSSLLDTQIGAMLFGRAAGGVVNYFLAVFNGNANSQQNPFDNNGGKELQAKIELQPHPSLTFGVGFDTDQMVLGTLSLVDHAFVPVVSGFVTGTRTGVEGDLDWQASWFSWHTEVDYFTFPDSNGALYLSSLYGGYTQFGFQLTGDKSSGLQLIARSELARAVVGGNHDLYSEVFGLNFFINSNLSNMINYIMEIPTAAAGAGTYASTGIKNIFYDQLMVKF